MDTKPDKALKTLISQERLLQALISHWQQAVEKKQSVSVFLIEVDNFSSLNRKSACFNTITQSICSVLHRQDDFIARFNRKKLIFITTMLDFKQAAQLANHLHQTVNALELVQHQRVDQTPISLSIGHLTYMPEKNETFGPIDMLETVFEHCRHASESGGNCSKTRLHSRLLKKTTVQTLARPY